MGEVNFERVKITILKVFRKPNLLQKAIQRLTGINPEFIPLNYFFS